MEQRLRRMAAAMPIVHGKPTARPKKAGSRRARSYDAAGVPDADENGLPRMSH
jgi:hypothetical protein